MPAGGAENVSVGIVEIPDSVTVDITTTSQMEESGLILANASDTAADNSFILQLLARNTREDFLPDGLVGEEQTNHTDNGSTANDFFTRGSSEVQPYTFVLQWGTPGSGNGQFYHPQGIAIDKGGNVYVADTSNHRVQKFSSDGIYITQWGTKGNGNGQFYNPYDITVDRSGYVYVMDASNHRVQKFSSEGSFITKWGTQGTGDGQFSYPLGISTDISGNVYVADTSNNRVQKFSSEGSFITKWGTLGTGNGQFNCPFGVVSDIMGNVYIADTLNWRIQKFNSDGTYITQWGTQGWRQGQFYNIERIASDTSGYIYATDGSNHRVQKFTPDGTYITQLGGEQGTDNDHLYLPSGVAVDASGNLYVIEPTSSLSWIKKYKPVAEPEVFTFSTTEVLESPNADYRSGFITSQNVERWLGDKAGWKLIFNKSWSSVTKADFGTDGEGLNDATFHWHTGHGAKNRDTGDTFLGLQDFEGSYVSTSDVDGKWGGKNKWTVLVSCEVLSDQNWGKAMSTSHGIFGFNSSSVNDPRLPPAFFHYAMDEKWTLYNSWRTATKEVLGDTKICTEYIWKDGKPVADYVNGTNISISAGVLFKTPEQLNNDHLPGYGMVEPDGDPDIHGAIPMFWDCSKKEV